MITSWYAVFISFRIGSHAIVLDVEVNSCRSIILQRQFKAFPVVMRRCSFLRHRSERIISYLHTVLLVCGTHSSVSLFTNVTYVWQKADLRCLLPRSLLDHSLFPASTSEKGGSSKCEADRGVCSYSWSGQRRMPSYINKLVFPENFLTALRTIAMQESNLFQVSEFLEEVQFLNMSLIPSNCSFFPQYCRYG